VRAHASEDIGMRWIAAPANLSAALDRDLAAHVHRNLGTASRRRAGCAARRRRM